MESREPVELVVELLRYRITGLSRAAGEDVSLPDDPSTASLREIGGGRMRGDEDPEGEGGITSTSSAPSFVLLWWF